MFGWTPDQIAQLTLTQIRSYINAKSVIENNKNKVIKDNGEYKKVFNPYNYAEIKEYVNSRREKKLLKQLS